MATIDSKVAHILDRRRENHDSDDEDALIAELEDEDDISVSHLREKRLQQLHEEVSRAKALKQTQHGTYHEIKDEKELMSITTSTKLCIVHFFHPDFSRCGYMDTRLEALAEKHYEARFVRINVEHAPFLVVKLGVKVLPCVICFREGVSTDRIIGFEGIGWKEDSFTIKELEGRLLKAGVLERAKVHDENDVRRVRERRREEEVDDGDDWD